MDGHGNFNDLFKKMRRATAASNEASSLILGETRARGEGRRVKQPHDYVDICSVAKGVHEILARRAVFAAYATRDCT